MTQKIEELIAAYEQASKDTDYALESNVYQLVASDLRTLIEPEVEKKRYFLVFYTICLAGTKGQNYSRSEILALEMEDGTFPSQSDIKECFNNDYLSLSITGIQELSEQDFLSWTGE